MIQNPRTNTPPAHRENYIRTLGPIEAAAKRSNELRRREHSQVLTLTESSFLLSLITI